MQKRTLLTTINSFISGKAVANDNFIKRLPVLLWGAMMMMIYIAIGFSSQAKHSQVEKLSMQIQELRTISVATSALRTEITRRANIVEQLQTYNINLEIPKQKPILIK